MKKIVALFTVIVSSMVLTISIAYAQPAPRAVDMQGFAFNPASLTIPTGTTVTWTNRDAQPHNATSQAGSAASFATANLTTNQTGSITITVAGTYNYICTIHPNMRAQIIAQAAGTPPATGDFALNSLTLLMLGAAGLIAAGGAIFMMRRSGRTS